MYPNENNGSAVTVLQNFSETCWMLRVDLPIQTGKTQYFFGNVKRLQDTLLQRFIVVVNSNLTLAADGSTSLVPESFIDQGYLYLQDRNSQNKIDGNALTYFKVNTSSNATNPAYVFPGFKNEDIDWERSYIQFPSSIIAAQNGKVLSVHIQFMWKKDALNWNQR
jgi:hypothetical protein